MRSEKLLLITFDYELFLGEQSGSVQECLINPTNRLLECMSRHGLKSYFFVDTVYLLRLKEMAERHPSSKTDLDLVISQLVQLVKSGHEIYPHIHPHWVDATYDSKANQWNLGEKRYYTFASITSEKQSSLFEQSVHIIQSILKLANREQSVDSYRAGGWSIEPFKQFRTCFLQYGIKNEFSVIPGKYQFSDAHSFDFRQAPTTKPVYRFDEDTCREVQQGPFTEWTISSITMNRFETWFDFKISGMLKRLGKRPSYHGKGVSSNIRDEGDIYCKPNSKRIVASFEGLNPFTLEKYLFSLRKADYFHFISHPKLITSYEIKMIDRLFGKLQKDLHFQTDFRKYPVD
jgi:hypothetical protein